jgi:CheY-like chemotaxis protein
LVAEGDPMNRKDMSRLLRRNGFPHDLVLMDCSMPVMAGYEATRVIKERMTGGTAPYIIGLTGYAGNGAQERGLQSGMNYYLRKPIEPARLCQELRAALAVKLVS